ncbi:MAG: tetratricopeptide repeat protein [Planctomycetes bacterium]|nr:tetratricopeptide repeat protein [Planctomycetota bacterium]
MSFAPERLSPRPAPRMLTALLALLPPIAVLGLLEGALAAAGVQGLRYMDFPGNYWVPAVACDGTPGYRRARPRPFKAVPEPEILFLREKPQNGLRIFLLGDSAIYGWPYEVGSVSDWLQSRLESMLDGRTVEVVNAGNPGWNAAEVRELARECGSLAADCLVVAAGNCEYQPESLAAARAEASAWSADGVRRRLLRLRFVGIAGAVIPEIAPERAFLAEEPLGEEVVFTDADVAMLRTRFRKAIDGLVDDAAKEQIPLLLVTPPRNLRSREPNGSYFSRETLSAPPRKARWEAHFKEAKDLLQNRKPLAALAKLQEAERIDALPAKLHYQKAKALEQAKRHDEARSAYEEAARLETRPSRVPPWALEETRAAAARCAPDAFLDFERTLHRRAPYGVAGAESLLDASHPNEATHALFAGVLTYSLEKLLALPLDRSKDSKDLMGPAADRRARFQGYAASRERALRSLDAGVATPLRPDDLRQCVEAATTTLSFADTDWEVVAAKALAECLLGTAADWKARLEQAIHSDPYVKRYYLLLRETEPRWRAVTNRTGIHWPSLRASLTHAESVVLRNQIQRARSK